MTAELWVSQSDAAKRETAAGRPVTQSSISRFIAANPDVPVRRNGSGAVQAVEYNALAAARLGSLGVLDRLAERSAAPAPQPQASSSPSNRKRQLEEEKLELDLAERKGEVLSRAAVAAAWEATGVAIQQSLERSLRARANQLLGITDLRAMELALKASDRELLQTLSRALADAAGEMADGGGEPLAA